MSALACLVLFKYSGIEKYSTNFVPFQTKHGYNKCEKEKPVWFVPSYVPARPGPAVQLTTYITKDQGPSWDVQKKDIIVHLPKPRRDGHITQYRKRDIIDLLSSLKNISANVPKKYRNKSIQRLKDIEATMKPEIRKSLNNWYAITKGSPREGRPMNEIIRHLQIITNKKDPEKPWTLKCDSCFKNEYKTILDPCNACAGDNIIDIVAIVTTVPRSVLSRKTIRETWGSWTRNNTSNFRLIFLFGKGWPEKDMYLLANESSQHGDILQEDYRDSYYNLTQKVISGFKWVLRSCSRARFIMRAAEDGFVNVPEVLYLLQMHGSHPRFQGYQIGRCLTKVKVHRWPDYKLYISNDEYADHITPPYALGTGFITSNDLTKRIVSKSKDINFMPVEDAYFGLVLREIGSGCLNVRPFSSAMHSMSDSVKKKMYNRLQKHH